jgi:hypothetical protein
MLGPKSPHLPLLARRPRFARRWRAGVISAAVEPGVGARGQRPAYPPSPTPLWEIWALVQPGTADIVLKIMPQYENVSQGMFV